MTTEEFERSVVFQLQRLGEIQEANTARMKGTVDEVRQLRALVQQTTLRLEATLKALAEIGGDRG